MNNIKEILEDGEPDLMIKICGYIIDELAFKELA